MRTASHASRSGARAGIWPPVRAACLALLIAGPPAIAVAQNGASLGATVDGLLAAGRQLSPSFRAAALRTPATIAQAAGADARGDQPAVLQALGEETAARTDVARLEGDRETARAQLNALVARGAEAPLAEPLRLRPLPASGITVTALLERARGNSPTLAASSAEIDAARTRSKLADKAWFPDVTLGVGPLIQTNNRPPGVAATIGINIPLSWGREESEQKQAIARLGAARQRYDAALLAIQATLGEALARLKAAPQTGDLLDREALPQARAAQKSIAAGYSQGRSHLPAPIHPHPRAPHFAPHPPPPPLHPHT